MNIVILRLFHHDIKIRVWSLLMCLSVFERALSQQFYSEYLRGLFVRGRMKSVILLLSIHSKACGSDCDALAILFSGMSLKSWLL